MKSKFGLKDDAPLGYLVHEVARLMKRRFEEEARLQGVTLTQWRMLAQIGHHEEMSQVALAAALDTDAMTVSGVLDRLEKRGLIERSVDPNDSRVKLARITPTGLELFATARKLGLAMYEAALDGITDEERSAAIAALKKMRSNLSGQPADLEDA